MITWDTAQTTCQNMTSDTSATSLTIFKTLMNVGYKYLLAELGRSVTEKTKTGSTVASQQFYQMPPDFLWVKTITITIGSNIYPIVEVVDQEEWEYLNNVSQTSDLPSFYFVRPYFGVGGAEIGIYPIPSSNGNTITIVYEASDKDLATNAYSTGTIAVTNGSATVTGSGTAFIDAMVGRYFNIADPNGDGLFYQVASRTSSTVMTLGNYYAGATGSGLSYTVSQAFALPEEIQILPIYYALGHYYKMKENTTKSIEYLGQLKDPRPDTFWGGVAIAKRRYGTKSRSNVIRNRSWWLGNAKGSMYPVYFPPSISS